MKVFVIAYVPETTQAQRPITVSGVAFGSVFVIASKVCATVNIGAWSGGNNE